MDNRDNDKDLIILLNDSKLDIGYMVFDQAMLDNNNTYNETVYQFRKDDNNSIEKGTFAILAMLTFIVFVSGLANTLILFRNGRFKNLDLIFFYLFALLTLFCKVLFFLKNYSNAGIFHGFSI